MKPTMKVVDKDRGFIALMKRAKAAQDGRVKVGVLAGDEKGGREVEGGLTVAEIAAIQHFGTSTIPPRPFLTQAFDKHREELSALGAQLIKNVIAGNIPIDTALGAMGAKLSSEAKAILTSGIAPPLATSTLRQRDGVGMRKLDRASKRVDSLIEAQTDRSTGHERKSAAQRSHERAQKQLDRATKSLGKKSRSIGTAFGKIGRHIAASARAEKAQRRAIGDTLKRIGRIAAARNSLAKAQERIAGHKPLIDTGRLLNAITWAVLEGKR